MSSAVRLGRACVLDRPNGTLTLQEFPVPEPAPGAILLRTEMAAMCATDVHVYHGKFGTLPYPLIMGHENVGTVVALGQGVNHDFVGNPLKVGDRVVPWQGGPCGECYFCRILDQPTLCRNPQATGFSFRADREPYFSGGYSEYLYLPNPRFPVFKTDVSPERAALAIPCSEALNTTDTAQIRRGEQVVVQGVGMQGLMSIAWARKMGASCIIAVGAPAERLRIACELGAAATLDIFEVVDPQERIRLVREMTIGGYGADAVLQCTGAPGALSEGLAYARDAGRMVDMGHASEMGPVTIDVPRELVTRGVNLLVSFGTTPERLWQAVRFLEADEFDWDTLVTHKLPLERIKDGLEAMESGYQLDGRELVRIAVAPHHNLE